MLQSPVDKSMQQMVWYAVIALQCCCGLLLAAPFEVSGAQEELPAGLLQEEAAERMRAAAAMASPDMDSQDWLRLLLQSRERSVLNNLNTVAYPKKRYTGLGLPYLKYHYDKRNNGVWIWMPAQGYVSVPRKQQEGDNKDAINGKIMRYGKRAFLL